MASRTRVAFLLLLALMPSPVKIAIMRRLLGWQIGAHCHIGLSLLLVRNVRLDDYVYIGNLTVFKWLDRLEMQTGSRIGRGNIFSSRPGVTSELEVGAHSWVTTEHYFDMSASITIGANCVVGGRRSNFFTHSRSHRLLPNQDEVAPIRVGDWCYLGSGLSVLPGVALPDHSFVGMGAVVGPSAYESYSVIIGNPAVVRARLEPGALYFSQPHLVLPHDPRAS